MTEHEWLTSTNPWDMFEAFSYYFTSRKARLFACACARNRSAWGVQTHYASSPYINVAELVADGARSVLLPMSDDDPLSLKALLYDDIAPARHWCSFGTNISKETLKYHCDVMRCLLGNPHCSISVSRMSTWCPDCGDTPDPWCDDCSGEGTIGIPTNCITAEVVALAQAAYNERPRRVCGDCKFDAKCVQCNGAGYTVDGTLDQARVSILADALEEAGCPITCLASCDRCWDYRHDPENPWGFGHHPERDPASGRDEGGWTNCKTCNSGSSKHVRPGFVRIENPILTHLRGPGPHWRGCYVLDEILGRK